jgi:four helix bundle protein
MGIKSFENLDCWIKASELRRFVSDICKTFPKEEKYRIVDQMLRCSRSVTNNIAEGYGRYHYQENIQFCGQSRGSLHELKDHFIICLDENLIDQKTFLEIGLLISECLALLNGYINFLIRQKTN